MLRRILRKRWFWTALGLVLLLGAAVLVAYLRGRGTPDAVRLLPEADVVVYVNLRVPRLARVFEKAGPVSHDPEYNEFVAATGFIFERDLDYAAIAMHANAAAPAADRVPSFASRARFSEVFVGRFDAERLAAYLRKLSNSVDRYREVEIFNIPQEERTVRVAIVGVDTAVVSNAPGSEMVRQMIDHYKGSARPRRGPSLVRDYHRHVPLGSVAWAIARVAPDSKAALRLPGGLDFPAGALAGATVVGSARYLGAIHLRVDAFTRSESNARNVLESAETFLAMFRSVQSMMAGGSDPDVRAFFDSLKIEQEKERLRLTATIPEGFIAKALSGPPPGMVGEPAVQTPPPENPKKSGRRGK